MSSKHLALNDLQALVAVAEARSFRQASAQLGVTPSALSHTVRSLEARMGVRLLNRTTRSVALAPAGAKLLATLVPALADIRRAVDEATQMAHEPQGCIRINAPRNAALAVLSPLVARFLAAHPRMEVELTCDAALVDIVAAGFDAGLRFGEALQPGMVAMPLGMPQRFVVVASPRYLARCGTPQNPADLAAHECVNVRFPSARIYRWQFAHPHDGRAFDVQVTGRLTANDQSLLLQGAADDLGLAYVQVSTAAPYLESGQVQAVLNDWMPPAEQMYLYYPSRRLQPAGFQAWLNWVRGAGQGPLHAAPHPG